MLSVALFYIVYIVRYTFPINKMFISMHITSILLTVYYTINKQSFWLYWGKTLN